MNMSSSTTQTPSASLFSPLCFPLCTRTQPPAQPGTNQLFIHIPCLWALTSDRVKAPTASTCLPAVWTGYGKHTSPTELQLTACGTKQAPLLCLLNDLNIQQDGCCNFPKQRLQIAFLFLSLSHSAVIIIIMKKN